MDSWKRTTFFVGCSGHSAMSSYEQPLKLLSLSARAFAFFARGVCISNCDTQVNAHLRPTLPAAVGQHALTASGSGRQRAREWLYNGSGHAQRRHGESGTRAVQRASLPVVPPRIVQRPQNASPSLRLSPAPRTRCGLVYAVGKVTRVAVPRITRVRQGCLVCLIICTPSFSA